MLPINKNQVWKSDFNWIQLVFHLFPPQLRHLWPRTAQHFVVYLPTPSVVVCGSHLFVATAWGAKVIVFILSIIYQLCQLFITSDN